MTRLIALFGCAVDCLFRVVLMGLKAAGLPMPVGDQGQPVSGDCPEQLRAALRQRLCVLMSRTGADEQGHQDNTELSRLNDSLRQGMCPYEDVAFYLACMTNTTCQFKLMSEGICACIHINVQSAHYTGTVQRVSIPSKQCHHITHIS